MDAQQLHGAANSPTPTQEPADELAVAADETVPAPEPFTWQASEYIHHQKGIAWYAGLFALLVVLVAVAILTKQWLAIAVFILMVVAVVVYAGKQPRDMAYTLDVYGITIGDKPYPFGHFRSFGIIQDQDWHAIDLEPTQRFMPRLTVLFESKDLDEIVNRLTAQLPRLDRQPDIIERAARTLRF